MSDAEKLPYIEEAASLKAKGAAEGGAVKKDAPITGKASKVDDDDSAGEDCPCAPATVPGQETHEAEGAVSEGEDDDEDDAGEDAADDAAEEIEDGDEDGAAAGEPSPPKGNDAARSQSLFIVSRSGLAKRIRLSDFRVGRPPTTWPRRNQRGKIGFKFHKKGDAVASMLVVPSDELPRPPRRPREPWVLYQERTPCNENDVVTGVTAVAAAPAEAVSDAAAAAVAAFETLSEVERKPWLERHAADVSAYNASMEARKNLEKELTHKIGQVLLCTEKGLMSRVLLTTVALQKKAQVGRAIMTVQDGDTMLCASVVSSLDDDDQCGDPTKDAEAPTRTEAAS